MTTPGTSADLPFRRPPGRYDERWTLPRPVLITGGALLGLLLVIGSYLAYDRFAGERVRFGTIGYQVLDDTAVEVRFEVRKALTDTVTCALQARDRDNTVVGRETVTVGPSDREQVLMARRVATTGRAATGEVVGCALAPTGAGSP